MSETVKKKPDFNSLDLSKITSGNLPTEAGTETPAPVQGLEMTDKESVKEGTWIDGVPVADLSPEDFHEWLMRILPAGTGVEKWERSIMATPAQREKLVLRVADLFYRGFSGLRTTPDKNQGKYNKQ